MRIKVDKKYVYQDLPDIYYNKFDLIDEDNTMVLKAMILTIPKVLETYLTDKQREIIKMIVFDELNQTQVANILEISQPTVSKQYEAAIAKLRKILTTAHQAISNYINISNEI